MLDWITSTLRALRRLFLGPTGRERDAELAATLAAPELFDADVHPDDAFAVRLLNDDVTTMDFVVAAIMEELKVDRRTAVVLMFTVHTRGHADAGRMRQERAEAVVASMSARARRDGLPFRCVVVPFVSAAGVLEA